MTYQGRAGATLAVVRTAARAVAVVLSIAFAVAVAASSAPAAPSYMPHAAAAHPTAGRPWTITEARAHWDATTGLVDDWFAQFHTTYQLQAYRTRSDLARAGRANAAAMREWAAALPVGRWSPGLRPLVRAVAVEATADAAWWTHFAALPTQTAMDRAYAHYPAQPATLALYRALLP